MYFSRPVFLQRIYQIFHPCASPCPTATNNGGAIAAAVISVLLILIIIAVILFCCYRSRHRKKYEKEICNEIRYSRHLVLSASWCVEQVVVQIPPPASMTVFGQFLSITAVLSFFLKINSWCNQFESFVCSVVHVVSAAHCPPPPPDFYDPTFHPVWKLSTTTGLSVVLTASATGQRELHPWSARLYTETHIGWKNHITVLCFSASTLRLIEHVYGSLPSY